MNMKNLLNDIGYVDIYVSLIALWHVIIFLLSLMKKYRFFSFSLLLSTYLLFIGIKIISLLYPTNETYQEYKRDEFMKEVSLNKDPIVLNITPSMWLTKIDARGIENIFTNEQRNEIGNFYPLGSAPNIKTFYCSEDEGFISYVTDRFGFRNNDVNWISKKNDILILGDSFAESACVKKSLQDYFDEKINTISLGKGGNGPLTSLAVMKEYFEDYKADIVFHLIVTNDYSREKNGGYEIDFDRELLDEQLVRYLEKDYYGIGYFSSVNLNPLRKFAIEYTNTSANKIERQIIKIKFASLFSYYYLRGVFIKDKKIIKINDKKSYENSRFSNHSALAEVYREMYRVSKIKKNKIFFVILPDKQSKCIEDSRHEYVKKLLKNEKLPVIDLWEHLCNKSYFAINGGHFNNEGYGKLAEFLQSDIQVKKILFDKKFNVN